MRSCRSSSASRPPPSPTMRNKPCDDFTCAPLAPARLPRLAARGTSGNTWSAYVRPGRCADRGAALLAAAGNLTWQAGFLGVFLGIWIGDALLYLLARGIGRPL